MKKYTYKKVDAFTSGTSMGNPAAFLILGGDDLSPQQMLKVGREHAGFVSEVVFCSDSKTADAKLTYYSSECEVAFCGHGTIATMYQLILNTPDLRNKPEVLIETNKKGLLTVFNALDSEGCVYITAPNAEYLTVPVSTDEISLALGAKTVGGYPLGFIDAGLRTLIVPIKELDEEISLFPDREALRLFCEMHGIDIILIFCMNTGSEAKAHTRVFAPRFGYLEDPATGSGNSAFGYYMLQMQIWDGEPVKIEQGGNNIVFNEVRLKCLDDSVLFGGRASLRIAGEYYLND